MKKRIFTFIILLVVSQLLMSQDINSRWGQFSDFERTLTTYEKDSTAHAVVLKEAGYTHIKEHQEYEILKEHYYRIKILDSEGASHATVEIPTYKDEKVKDIKASTTNFAGGKKTSYIKKSDIFKTQVSENWHQTSFTLPNIKPGSIIEYTYTIETPYRRTFADGWTFQGDIPKIKSSFYAKIPGFWEYHMSTVGIPSPRFTQNKLLNNCLEIYGTVAQCLFIELTIDNIPAFIEEDFVTSKYNFLKQLKFELKTVKRVDGKIDHYTKTWDDIDKSIFKQYQIGKEYDKTKFISKHISEDIFKESNELERAKKVFKFIQNRMHYNDKSGSLYEFDRKKAFEKKIGNVIEINAILINMLNAVGITADFALLSTRKNGLPNKVYPSISDFNYMVAHCKIDGKDYFLDAVEKNIPFGVLPFKCLNGELRIFNEVFGSYWFDFKPIENNGTKVYAIANVTEDADIKLQARVVNEGYSALIKRNRIDNLSLETYKEEIDDENEDLDIVNHKIEGLTELDKPLIETFDFESETDLVNNNTIYLKPFIIKDFKTNPFSQDNRQYPVDLGYKRIYQYNLTFNIPKSFKIKSIPKDRNIVLPREKGHLSYLSTVSENKISINFTFSLDAVIYNKFEYRTLKRILSELIIAQNETIILTKE